MNYEAFLTDERLMNTIIGGVVQIFSGVLVLILICWLFWKVVYGIFCLKLAHKKGYRGYFFTGFFWRKIGLNYVGSLPDRTVTDAIEKAAASHIEKAAPSQAEAPVSSRGEETCAL